MYYIEETLTPSVAKPKTIEAFIRFAEADMVPLCKARGAVLKAAWYSNAETLFQVTQTWALERIDDLGRFCLQTDSDPAWQGMLRRLAELMPQRRIRLLETVDPMFTTSLDTAIRQSQSEPVKTYTKAVLTVGPDFMEGFIQQQKEAVRAGLPMISFMCAVTGDINEVVDIWKGNLQETGYQKPEFYDSLGMTADWWEWIRQAAPLERMAPVFMLPYSPLR